MNLTNPNLAPAIDVFDERKTSITVPHFSHSSQTSLVVAFHVTGCVVGELLIEGGVFGREGDQRWDLGKKGHQRMGFGREMGSEDVWWVGELLIGDDVVVVVMVGMVMMALVVEVWRGDEMVAARVAREAGDGVGNLPEKERGEGGG
ncbi:hypothetical protein Tco_0712214 [Tanacetum coccineum]